MEDQGAPSHLMKEIDSHPNFWEEMASLEAIESFPLRQIAVRIISVQGKKFNSPQTAVSISLMAPAADLSWIHILTSKHWPSHL